MSSVKWRTEEPVTHTEWRVMRHGNAECNALAHVCELASEGFAFTWAIQLLVVGSIKIVRSLYLCNTFLFVYLAAPIVNKTRNTGGNRERDSVDRKRIHRHGISDEPGEIGAACSLLFFERAQHLAVATGPGITQLWLCYLHRLLKHLMCLL